MPIELPELTVPNAAAWRRWLSKHHADPQGVWLVLSKQGTTDPTSLTYAQALDEALCFGWIDGQTRRGDGASYFQRFTPRTRRSRWSKRNVGIVARLTSEGRMDAAGLAEVERAKADGRWETAYASAATIKVPADLSSALAANPRAAAMFEILTGQNRYAVLYRIGSAKRPETRARRIASFVDLLGRGETVYPQKKTLAD